jgi:hypothetical protein
MYIWVTKCIIHEALKRRPIVLGSLLYRLFVQYMHHFLMNGMNGSEAGFVTSQTLNLVKFINKMFGVGDQFTSAAAFLILHSRSLNQDPI